MDNRVVDARGLACPLPVVNAKKAAEEMIRGGTLTVLVDNEIAVQNLQKFAKQKGFEAKGEKKGDKELAVIMEIPESAGTSGKMQDFGEESGNADVTEMLKTDDAAEENTVNCAPDSRKKGMVIVLSGNVMGTGDEKLGRALMKAFVFAVTKQDYLPETILCYNTGAYLTCEGADTLEDIKSLEAEGVQILTCGTCLDFYGIKEKLAVGSVTNMYEIVEVMERAKTIVRP